MAGLDWSKTCATWVSQLCRMEPEAWQRFMSRRRPGIVRIAASRGLGPADAEAVANDVEAALFQVMRDGKFVYDGSGTFGGYLVTMTRHKIADFRRARQPVPLPDHREVEDHVEHEWDGHLERLWDRVQDWLRRGAEGGDRDLEIWRLSEAGRSVAEIAAQHRLTPGAVYQARYRVKQALLDLIEQA